MIDHPRGFRNASVHVVLSTGHRIILRMSGVACVLLLLLLA